MLSNRLFRLAVFFSNKSFTYSSSGAKKKTGTFQRPFYILIYKNYFSRAKRLVTSSQLTMLKNASI